MEGTREMDSNNRSERRRERAIGRWQLLKHAILVKKQNNDLITFFSPQNEPSISIHHFQGFGLLSPPTILRLDDDDDSTTASLSRMILDSLTRIKLPDHCNVWTLELLVKELRVSLLAIGALIIAPEKLDHHQQQQQQQQQQRGSSMDLSLSPPLPPDLTEEEIAELLVGEDTGIDRCQVLGDETIRVTMSSGVSSRASSLSSFCSVVRKYSVDPSTCVLTRERGANRKTSLRELASHRHHGVDNTGNVCIWDAEKTLTWALLQEASRNIEAIKIVTELGVGMAGMAALALAAKGVIKSQVNLTDGHADCVLNNQVNVRLMKAAGILHSQSPHVQCSRLLWTCDSCRNDEPYLFPPPADWTIVSDCTHFEEHHGNLFWTLVECTKVNGFIWMCQPRRGLSLNRFLSLVDDVNAHSGGTPLIRIQERLYNAIEQKHRSFLETEAYNADIHKPLIFTLEKLREATERDRLRVMHCMETRDDAQT